MDGAQIGQCLAAAFPQRQVTSWELLLGGARHHNYLVHFDDGEAPAVLRIYSDGANACEKETAVLRTAAGSLPVAEWLNADSGGSTPYLIYRYAEGTTFQELKKQGEVKDIAAAAYAMGAALAKVASAPHPELPGRPSVSTDFLDAPLLVERIGAAGRDRLRDYLTPWMPRLNELLQERGLVHGDFNNRNTVLRRQGDAWTVAAILDWEYAFQGSPLWDAARFVCYEHPERPLREPHFSLGYREAGGRLPEDWREFASAINIFTAAEGLSSADLPGQFVAELCELVGRAA